MRVLTVDELHALIRATRTEPVFLLGAGASVSAGVPLAADMAQRALRWATALARGWDPDDSRLKPSDVQRFLERQAWYDPRQSWADRYPQAMQLLSTPRDLRRRFLMEMLHGVSRPSQGYLDLADLAKRGYLRTILSTNFDSLFDVAYRPGPYVTVSGPSQYHAITTSPPYPQFVYLHGQVEYYLDRITAEEVQDLDPALVERVFPLIRDHPLVVIGYRGAEPSVMRGLLLNRLGAASGFPRGIFWCLHGSDDSSNLSPLTRELASVIGDNFALVPSNGFDETLAEYRALAIRDAPLGAPVGAPTISPLIEQLPFDMRPCVRGGWDNLDQALLREAVRAYQARFGATFPEHPDEDWLEARLAEMGLLVSDSEGVLRPTNGAMLLFGDEGRSVAPGAWLEVWTPQRPPKAVDGPLLRQYEAVSAILETTNRPVRIKGARSMDRQPYGPLALKEFLANALVHRDYEARPPILISIQKDAIRFESPGGLDASLLEQLGRLPEVGAGDPPIDVFRTRIQSGDAGPALTGYRNPVIAEIFWALGYVEKAGSGLAQAAESLRDQGAESLIEIPDANDRFAVTAMTSRLRVDALTQTAVPVRPSIYTSNLFEFLSLAPVIWRASSPIRDRRDVLAMTRGMGLPSFVPHSGQVYTFSDLTDPANPLGGFVQLNTVVAIPRDDVIADPSTGTIAPNLLRQVVEGLIQRAGLRIDRRRQRAYFACYNSVVRSLPGAGRRRTRRIAWWPDGFRKGHCVHKAINYRVERYDDSWALLLQPTFVCTFDGKSDFLPGRENARRVTALLASHFNPAVRADVRFWAAHLADGRNTIDIDEGYGSRLVIDARPAGFEGFSEGDAP